MEGKYHLITWIANVCHQPYQTFFEQIMFVLYVVLQGCGAQSKQGSKANAEVAWIETGSTCPFYFDLKC